MNDSLWSWSTLSLSLSFSSLSSVRCWSVLDLVRVRFFFTRPSQSILLPSSPPPPSSIVTLERVFSLSGQHGWHCSDWPLNSSTTLRVSGVKVHNEWYLTGVLLPPQKPFRSLSLTHTHSFSHTAISTSCFLEWTFCYTCWWCSLIFSSLSDSSSPLKHQCSITSFTFDKVSVMFGNHTVSALNTYILLYR